MRAIAAHELERVRGGADVDGPNRDETKTPNGSSYSARTDYGKCLDRMESDCKSWWRSSSSEAACFRREAPRCKPLAPST